MARGRMSRIRMTCPVVLRCWDFIWDFYCHSLSFSGFISNCHINVGNSELFDTSHQARARWRILTVHITTVLWCTYGNSPELWSTFLYFGPLSQNARLACLRPPMTFQIFLGIVLIVWDFFSIFSENVENSEMFKKSCKAYL